MHIFRVVDQHGRRFMDSTTREGAERYIAQLQAAQARENPKKRAPGVQPNVWEVLELASELA